MSRREARIARKLLDHLKQQEKSARFQLQVSDHQVRAAHAPARTIRAGKDPNACYRQPMTYTLAGADRDGAWASGTPRQWSEKTWEKVIEPFLKNMEALIWAEIERQVTGTGHRKHHGMPTDILAAEAQRRLIDIERWTETLFRFRLGNKRRLWGERVVAEFHILWFDPEHEIYPTDPD